MRKWLGVALGVACLLIPTTGRAWWDMGHMAVAAIAYDRLEPAARARVGALLRLNPDFEACLLLGQADRRLRDGERDCRPPAGIGLAQAFGRLWNEG